VQGEIKSETLMGRRGTKKVKKKRFLPLLRKKGKRKKGENFFHPKRGTEPVRVSEKKQEEKKKKKERPKCKEEKKEGEEKFGGQLQATSTAPTQRGGGGGGKRTIPREEERGKRKH